MANYGRGENMDKSYLAYHETMDLHEILNMKTVSLLKSKLIQGIVFDQDLRALMEKDVQQSIQAINELRELYEHIPNLH